jgi:hypothetical protein
LAERNDPSAQARSTPPAGGEGGTTLAQWIFLILLVPVTVATFTGPIVGATLAGLTLLSSTLLLLGVDR